MLPAPFGLQIPPCQRILVGQNVSQVCGFPPQLQDSQIRENLLNHECIRKILNHDVTMLARRHAPRSCDLPNWCGHLTGISIGKPSCSKTHSTVVQPSSAKHFTNKNTAAWVVSSRLSHASVPYIPLISFN